MPQERVGTNNLRSGAEVSRSRGMAIPFEPCQNRRAPFESAPRNVRNAHMPTGTETPGNTPDLECLVRPI